MKLDMKGNGRIFEFTSPLPPPPPQLHCDNTRFTCPLCFKEGFATQSEQSGVSWT